MLFGPTPPAWMSEKDVRLWDEMNAKRKKVGAPELPYPASKDTRYVSQAKPGGGSVMVETTAARQADDLRAVRKSLGLSVVTKEQQAAARAAHNARIAQEKKTLEAVRQAQASQGPDGSNPPPNLQPQSIEKVLQQSPTRAGIPTAYKVGGLVLAIGLVWWFFKKKKA